VGQELIVLLIAAIALAFCCFMARRGVTTDPWRVRVDRHGVGMRSCTEAVDSLILAGGGQLSIPGYAGTPPAQLLARMRKVGLVGDAHQRGFDVDVLPGTARAQRWSSKGAAELNRPDRITDAPTMTPGSAAQIELSGSVADCSLKS